MSGPIMPRTSLSRVKQYCYECDRFWVPVADELPKLCPLCKLSKWDMPAEKTIICKTCGKNWNMKNLDDPCPNCGYSRLESEFKDLLKCNQCEHEWMKRTNDLPLRCPSCKTTKWNDERIVRNICNRCGYKWKMRAEKPKKCPKCQSHRWNTPLYKLQCKRCGYKWITHAGKTSEDVRMCPSCKSRKWNKTPQLMLCTICGSLFINRSDTLCSKCPACSGKKTFYEITCDFCKITWVSTSSEWCTCPRCGKPKHDEEKEITLDIWNNDRFSLRYTNSDDFSFIYLWENGVPIATIYFHDLLAILNITAEQFTAHLSDLYDFEWINIAYYMYDHRDDHLKNIPQLMEKLGIDRFDATILSFHFTGMCPEAIAVRLGLSYEDVRISFDRIMEAYKNNDINVNDSSFTENPMSLY